MTDHEMRQTIRVMMRDWDGATPEQRQRASEAASREDRMDRQINIRKAAAAMGRKGGAAGKGTPLRREIMQRGLRTRWGAPVWERRHEWTHTVITARPTGWIVSHDSAIQGEYTGSRYLIPYTEEIPQGQDLEASWNEGTTYGDALVERRLSGRCLRRGQLVQ